MLTQITRYTHKGTDRPKVWEEHADEVGENMQVVIALMHRVYTSETMELLFPPYVNRLEAAACNEWDY